MKKMIIDTDCGIDDAVAIMMALAAKDYEVAGITTVSGNVKLQNVNHNVLRLLSYFNREDIPVFQGAFEPLCQRAVRAESTHGHDGLGGVFLPETSLTIRPQNAPEGIYKLAKANPGISLVALGPLTNIAIAVNLYPELNKLIGNIVSMGGAIDRGNVTRWAEFNYYADPESVAFVLNTQIPLEIVPWDPCLEHLILEDDVKSMLPWDNKAADLFLKLQEFPFTFVEKYYGIRGTMLPDPLAMAYALNNQVAKRKLIGNIKMDLSNNTHRGESVLCEGERIKLILQIHRESFLEVLKTIFIL